MLESFVTWTLLAALMQAVRTAAQKTLNQTVSVQSATLVRYLFGLPFVVIYGAFLLESSVIDRVTGIFFVNTFVPPISFPSRPPEHDSTVSFSSSPTNNPRACWSRRMTSFSDRFRRSPKLFINAQRDWVSVSFSMEKKFQHAPSETWSYSLRKVELKDNIRPCLIECRQIQKVECKWFTEIPVHTG